MKKRICCITIALCTVLCIVFAAGCGKTEKNDTALPEVRNNGTAIQWKYSDETDWRDLVLLTELMGAAGENGKNGTDGKDGADGKDGTNGINGQDGRDGADGNTPFIGENGNWWIGEIDTGVKAAGTDGTDGVDGTDGEKGDKGAC